MPKRNAVTYSDFRITPKFTGNAPNPLNKDDMNSWTIQIANWKIGAFTTLSVWPKNGASIDSDKDVLIYFGNLLNCAVIGAFQPEEMCQFLNIPLSHLEVMSPTMDYCRYICANMAEVITGDIPALLHQMQEDGILPKREVKL